VQLPIESFAGERQVRALFQGLHGLRLEREVLEVPRWFEIRRRVELQVRTRSDLRSWEVSVVLDCHGRVLHLLKYNKV